jgi:hypothetical protein
MKFTFTQKLSIIFCLFISMNSLAQNDKLTKYRRSSLSMVLLESETFPNKEAVMSSWNNYPFPDKYNKHDINTKSFSTKNVNLDDDDLRAAGFLKDTIKGVKLEAMRDVSPLRYINDEKTLAYKLPNERQTVQLSIDKVLSEKQVAKQMIKKWFDITDNNEFPNDYITLKERAFYDASEADKAIANGQSRGLDYLMINAEDLIYNSFVTFSKLNFYENEPVAKAALVLALNELDKTDMPQPLKDKAKEKAQQVYEKAKEGYSLWSKTWLYQINWNDSLAALFYETWGNQEAFDKLDIFTMKFIGSQYNQSLVTFKIGETRTQEQLIDLALVRNLDNTFAKLQKKNDVFKPKVPVLTSGPITAQIGMKEGLEGGEKFEVLEMVLNKDGKVEYKVVGKAAVDKKIVWDNRYGAGEEGEIQKDADGNVITSTIFKGSKKIQPGMLLKLKK